MEIAEIQVSYSNSNKDTIKIRSSKDSYDVIINSWNADTLQLQEEFKVILLNRSNTVLGIYPLSRGGVSGTIIDMKLLFSVALKCISSSMIIVHNHPSGSLTPSNADLQCTRRIKEVCKLLDITLLDHIIIAKNGYFSFCDEGRI
jgi:DNA repair protein RadC